MANIRHLNRSVVSIKQLAIVFNPHFNLVVALVTTITQIHNPYYLAIYHYHTVFTH